MSRDLYMPNDRYRAALDRLKSQIEAGSELSYYDDTTPGDKSTSCTWGLCSTNPEQWPDKQDRLFPRDYPLATKYRKSGQHCPFDKDQDLKTTSSGCFYRCRVFGGEFAGEVTTAMRARAVELYQVTIELHAQISR